MKALGLATLGLTLALAVPADPAGAQSILDFVTFDRIDYIHWLEEPGRPLVRDDLGAEYATVVCSIGEDARRCSYGMDAAAAYMPAGTRLYAVRGYRTEFRLAAVWRERIYLYQAWRNPRAKVGGDLFDIAGRVRAIDVRRGNRPDPAAGAVAIGVPEDVEALVAMILKAPMRGPQPRTSVPARYWLTLRLADGTTLGRGYDPATGVLMGGVALPAEFGVILRRYLPE